MSCTRIRIPRIQGRPPHLPGSTVIRFDRSEDMTVPISLARQWTASGSYLHSAHLRISE